MFSLQRPDEIKQSLIECEFTNISLDFKKLNTFTYLVEDSNDLGLLVDFIKK